MADNVRTPNSRVFTIEDRAGPSTVPVYQGRTRAQGFSWGFGDRTPIREPDPNRYGSFRIVDSIKAERDLPALSLQARYQFQLSAYLELARRGCPLDIQVHMGKCQDPRDFNRGWDKILVLEGADFSNYSTDDLGALTGGEDAIVNEALDLSGLDAYEIKQVTLAQLAASQVTNEIVDITVCDAVTCGLCGISSDGCSKFFALQLKASGSPGLSAELVASSDGGGTLIERNIASLPVNMDPTALGCVGTRLAVLSNGDQAIHYATIADILTSSESWTRNAAGITGGGVGEPNDIFSFGSGFTWVVGNDGHIYFYNDIAAAAVAQDSGSATSQNLNAIHGFDEQNLVAVGASNAVVYTRNGGSSWASVTGPAVGVALNTVWMRGPDEWFVGAANGRLFYTRNAGSSWTEKSFSGSGSGAVRDIVFATPTVGYLAHDVSGAGRILRTIDGGSSWYVAPEGSGSIPTNTRINALAACAENVNTAYAGGLVGTDGIIVKVA